MAYTTGMVKVGLLAPGGEFETMWATPVGINQYRLENSPFYAYRVSWLDVVEAFSDETGLPVVRRRIEKSGHRTVRLILVPDVDESPERQKVLDDLNALGCTYEGYNPRYFSIDIPPETRLEPVVDYLTRGEHQWEYADPTYDEIHGVESSTSGEPAS